MMRKSDAFVFPSIRELGAGVVIEAMACGCQVIVANYGAPGDLADQGRGARVDMGTFDRMVDGFRLEMEACAEAPANMAETAERAKSYADGYFPWAKKGEKTVEVYRALLDGRPLEGLGY